MLARALAKQYQYNLYVIEKNLEGITAEETLLHPDRGGNTIRWVLGHILYYRNPVLGLIGKEMLWNGEHGAQFKQGSQPITDESSALPLDELLNGLRHSQETLIRALEEISEDSLGKQAPGEESTVGDEIAGYTFHEAYHCGQIGVLRRVVGKEGALK